MCLDAIKLVGVGHQKPLEIPAQVKLYRNIFKDAQYTDMILTHTNTGKQIKALRGVLASRSPYLKALITSASMQQAQFPIVVNIECDVRFEVLLGVIEFLYCSFVRFKPADLVQAYILSNDLQIPELADFCVTRFKNEVKSNNVLHYYGQAFESNCTKLLGACKQFIVDNFKEVFLLPDLHIVQKEDLIEICRTIARNSRNGKQ